MGKAKHYNNVIVRPYIVCISTKEVSMYTVVQSNYSHISIFVKQCPNNLSVYSALHISLGVFIVKLSYSCVGGGRSPHWSLVGGASSKFRNLSGQTESFQVYKSSLVAVRILKAASMHEDQVAAVLEQLSSWLALSLLPEGTVSVHVQQLYRTA